MTTTGKPNEDSSHSSASDEEYEQRNRSCEEVSSDELEGDLNLSENEMEAQEVR